MYDFSILLYALEVFCCYCYLTTLIKKQKVVFLCKLCVRVHNIYIYIRETGQFSSKGIINDFIGNLNRLPIKHFNSVFTIFWDFIGNLNRL